MDPFGALTTVDQGPLVSVRGCAVPLGCLPINTREAIVQSQKFVACPVGLPYDTEHSDCQSRQFEPGQIMASMTGMANQRDLDSWLLARDNQRQGCCSSMCLSCHQPAALQKSATVDGSQTKKIKTVIGGVRKSSEAAKIRGLAGRQREEICSCISVALCQGTTPAASQSTWQKRKLQDQLKKFGAFR